MLMIETDRKRERERGKEKKSKREKKAHYGEEKSILWEDKSH